MVAPVEPLVGPAPIGSWSGVLSTKGFIYDNENSKQSSQASRGHMVVITQAISQRKPEPKHTRIVTFLLRLEHFFVNEGIQTESRAEKDHQQRNVIQPFSVRGEEET